MKRKARQLSHVALRYSTEGEWFQARTTQMTIGTDGRITIIERGLGAELDKEGGAVRAIFSPNARQLLEIIAALQKARSKLARRKP